MNLPIRSSSLPMFSIPNYSASWLWHQFRVISDVSHLYRYLYSSSFHFGCFLVSFQDTYIGLCVLMVYCPFSYSIFQKMLSILISSVHYIVFCHCLYLVFITWMLVVMDYILNLFLIIYLTFKIVKNIIRNKFRI
jgi:hypothetical protein